MSSVSSVSASDARMVALRSPVMESSMSPGSAAFTCGIAAFRFLIVLDDVRARLLVDDRITPGLPLTRPRLRRSSTESSMCPHR